MKKTIIILAMLFCSINIYSQTSTWTGGISPFTHGNGTQANPHLIENAEQLAYLAQVVNAGTGSYDSAYYKVMIDIDLNSIPWTPIGFSSSNFFSGNFDGNGHNIANMIVNSSTAINGYGGLFGYIKNATIKKVGIIGNSSVSAINYAGGIAGYSNENSLIELCFNKANVTVSNLVNNTSNITYSGGICGYGNNYILIDNCFNLGNVSSSAYSDLAYAYASGICNSCNSISNCYNTGSVLASATSSLSQSYAHSYQSSIGYSSAIYNSYFLNINNSNINNGGTPQSEATMKSPAFVDILNNGAFVWIADEDSSNNGYPIFGGNIQITSIDNITLSSATFKGFIEASIIFSAKGFQYKLNTDNAFTSITLTNNNFIYNINNLLSDTTYIVRAFAISGNDTIFSKPKSFKTSINNVISGGYDTWNGNVCAFTHGNGTINNPYLIERACNLAYMANMVNAGNNNYDSAYYKVMIDIDLNSIPWTPIGFSSSNFFSGNFDGNGHNIANMIVNSSTAINGYGGLFGYIKNATIKKVGIIGNSSVSAINYAGGIAGYSNENSLIELCFNKANVTVSNLVNNTSNITYSGGICGYGNNYILIDNCFNLGNVSSSAYSDLAYAYASGICNSCNSISNCYNTGSVLASATSSLSQSYAHSYQSSIGYSSAIYNSYFLNINNSNINNGGTPQSEATMKSPAFVDILNNGAFVWIADEDSSNNGYPIFGGNIQITSIDNITLSSATFKGFIEASIIFSAKGFQYKLNTDNAFTSITLTNNNFIYNINNLLSDTTYIVRAFAISGNDTIFSKPKSFKTSINNVISGGYDTWNGNVCAFTHGNGTINNPYLIERACNLAYMANMVNAGNNNYDSAYYKVMIDIDLNSIPWTPIGFSSSNFFSGNFDGNGHNIANMIVNSSTAINGYGGLFGYIKNATIKKVGIIGNSSVSAINYAGGIAGYSNENSLIELCFNKANVTVSNLVNNTSNITYSGGICGYGNNYILIDNCFNLGNVSSSAYSDLAYAYASGICNSCNSISNCYNTGSVLASATSSLSQSYAHSYQSSIGYSSAIYNSYFLNINNSNINNGGTPQSEATMKSPAFVDILNNGAFVWIADEDSSNNGYPIFGGNIQITSIDNITLSSATFKGFIEASIIFSAKGFQYKLNTDNAFTSITLTNNNFIYNINNLLSDTTYIVRAFAISGNDTIFSKPKSFKTSINNVISGGYDTWNGNVCAFTHGNGTINNPYLIERACNLAYMANMVNAGNNNYDSAYYKVMIDIDLNSIPWTPIGFSSSNFFSGNFDGNGHNIANMIVNSSTAINGYGGLFGYIKNATIKKVGIIGNSSVSAINYAGGIAGYSNENSLIELCFNKANVTVSNLVNNTSNITYSGGICGYGNNYILIDNCFNLGNVSSSAYSDLAYAYASGICNSCNSISNCYNTGSVLASATSSLSQSYAHSYQSSIGYSSAIYNSYFLNINNSNINNGGTPQSEATMKSPAFVTLLNNGSTNWVIDNLPYRNGGYPMLSVLVKPYARVEVNNISAISATLIGKINEYVTADAQGFLYKKTNTSNYISIPIIGSLYQYNLNNLEPNTQYIAKAYIIYNNLTYYGDSIIFSTLPLPITTTTTNICQGETYFFMDSSFSTTGIYPIVHNDTIHQLNLTVYPLYNDTLDINVCNGESFTFNDTIFSSSCYHTFYFQSIHGCDSIVTLHLTVLPEYRPIITITIDTSICRGDSITLTADGASSYLWNTNAITQSITVSPYNTTRYIVTASNSSDCYIKDTVIVTVKALPSPSITGTTIFCDGNNSTLTASGGVSYLWNTGDTTYSIIVDTAGIYSVLATGVNGCRKAVQKNVTVRPLPNLSLNFNDTTICVGESLSLIASGGSSYVWSSNQTSNSINVTPNSSISYSVTAYNSYNCSKTDTINVTVNPIPILSFNGDTSICYGSSTNITIYGAENYLWSNGETSSSLSLNPSSSTQYTVIGTNSYQCSSSLYIPITVHQPIYTIDTIHACNSFTWIDGITYYSNTNNPTFTLTSLYGCDSTVNLNLTIHQTENTIDYVSACNSFTWINGITYTQSTNTPTYTINSIYGCDSIVNLHLTMNHSSSGVDNQVHCKTYTWINGITYTSSTNTPTYTLTNYSGCDSVVHLNLTINPLPNVGITGNMDIFEGQTTELIASGANSYSWSNGSIEQTISVSPTQTTKYSVIGTDDKNCSDSASITINVHPNIGLNNIEISNLISIYPNPTDGKINIVNKSNELSIQKITLLNVLGEKILEKEITNRNEILLDLISYSSNIIFVEILLNNGEKFVKKIIKN